MKLYKRLPYITAAACSIFYFSPFLRLISQNGDEGTLIMGAVRVTEGQLPFRDFFEVMGPGTFYWLALFLKLLGTTWFATRLCLLVTTTAITVLLYYLARRLRCGLGAAPVIFFVAVSFHSWNAISHHMDSTLFGLLSFAAFVSWIDQRRSVTLLLAGVGAGLTTWFMLPKGLLLCFAFLLVLWILYRNAPFFRRSAAILLGGYLLIVICGVAWFRATGGLREMVYANLLWPLHHYGPTNVVPYGMGFRELYWESFMSSFRAVAAPILANAISGLLSVPFAVVLGLPLILLFCLARYRRATFDRTLLPYWVAGSAFYLSEMHRKDISHIVFGSPLLIILAFHFCAKIENRWASRALQLVTVSALSLALLNPLVALAARHETVTRRGVVYTYADNQVLTFMNAHIRPGEPVFVYPYAPMYYFLSATTNPTRHSILMYQINTEAQFRGVVESLESTKVRYVIWERSSVWIHKWFPEYRIPPEDELIVEPYLMKHYRAVGGTEGGFQFLERNESVMTSSVLPNRIGVK